MLTLESRTQVYMHTGGELEVHDNVVLEANTAGSDGGAVRLPFDTVLLPPARVLCGRFCEGWFDFLRHSPKPRRKG